MRKCWVVRVECVVLKELVVDSCTEEEAKNKPYDQNILEERELYQVDWKVIAVVDRTGYQTSLYISKYKIRI